MSRTATAISFLAPLALAPHLLFYYDVTPKIAILFVGAALVFILTAFDTTFNLDSLRAFCGTPLGKAFSVSVLALVAVTGLSVVLSEHTSLAWYGSNWRRFGGLTQGVCLILALILAASTRGSEDRMLPILRAICAAGLVAAVYGILQYFGWDPIQSATTYEAGEGPFRIVRPPSTMGHSDYFAAFLLWPVFLGLALSRKGSWLGWASAVTGAIAILLSGSRGALLGLAIGALLFVWSAKPRLRVWGTAVAVAVIAFGTFYISPAGERLRARAHWIGEDPAGGARLLLWRDSLRMAAARPWSGFGPDNFVAEFPKFQSVDLARLYPDFYHESPHNLWLDTVSGQGVPGLLAQLGIVLSAIIAGIRSLRVRTELAYGLLAGLIAALVAHQFAVFTVVNALYMYLGCALLISVNVGQDGILRPVGNRPPDGAKADFQSAAGFHPTPRALVFIGGSALALFLLVTTFRLVSTDLALASAERGLSAGDASAAAAAYRRAVDLRSSSVTADLYFSRRWARAAADAPDTLSKLYLAQLAAGSASLATQVPEGSPNAWFNVAELGASRNDPASVETALRSAIIQSPNWFKPHWALARLLFLQGRKEEARLESVKAMDLNQKDPEVASTLAPILSFRSGPPRSPNP